MAPMMGPTARSRDSSDSSSAAAGRSPGAMRRTLVAFLSLSLVVLAPAAGAATATDPKCPAPRCVDVAVPYPHDLKVPDNHVRIVLPAGYQSKGPGYPVLYL